MVKLAEIAPLSPTEREIPLMELSLKHLVAAGLIGVANPSLSPPVKIPANQLINPMSQEINQLTKKVLSKYHVSKDLAHQVALLAKKHEYATFPKAGDILAIVGIESSFDPAAKSKLKHDPAIGLTQVRPKVWGIDPASLKNDIEQQIAVGAEKLHHYYDKLQSAESAVHAYNIGITNFMHNKSLNPNYVEKFTKERNIYNG